MFQLNGWISLLFFKNMKYLITNTTYISPNMIYFLIVLRNLSSQCDVFRQLRIILREIFKFIHTFKI